MSFDAKVTRLDQFLGVFQKALDKLVYELVCELKRNEEAAFHKLPGTVALMAATTVLYGFTPQNAR